MSRNQEYMQEEEKKLKLSINGKQIPLIPFVHNALRDAMIAFLKNLKGFEKGKIEIEIDQ